MSCLSYNGSLQSGWSVLVSGLVSSPIEQQTIEEKKATALKRLACLKGKEGKIYHPPPQP